MCAAGSQSFPNHQTHRAKMAGRGIRPRYSAAKKLEIVRFAQTHSAVAACRRFRVARSSVYLWTEREDELERSLGEILLTQGAAGAHNDLPTAVATNDRVPGDADIPVDENDRGQAHEDAPHTSGAPALAPPAQTNPIPSVVENVHQSEESVTTRPPGGGDWDALPPGVASSNEVPAVDFVLIGYQGTNDGFAQLAAKGVFSELLSRRALPAPSFETTGYPQTSHVLDALQKNDIDYAIIPTDALSSNTHHAALDFLVASRLRIVGEVVCQDEVVVCALPGTELCDADCVISDWWTLQRYENYIIHLEMQFRKRIYRHVSWDSAAGCRMVKEQQSSNALVLCSARAAAAHELVVLQGRSIGVQSPTRYSVLGRHGTLPLAFDTIQSESPSSAMNTRRCTLFVKGTGRAILDVISAFAYRRLDIVSFHMRGSDDGEDLRSYVISYTASNNPAIEIGLQHHLAAASERVITLGNYTVFTL